MTAAKVEGLRIFPLHGITLGTYSEKICTCSLGAKCKDVGKHPLVSWRNYDDYEPNQLGPSKGFGIPTGSSNHVFVIDLDRREAKPEQPAQDGKPATPAKPAKDGVAAFLALAAGRPIPDTVSVVTGSGGLHLYFRYPELPTGYSIPCSKSELGSGVDVKGDGGYVVGPGSPHASGRSYELQDGPGTTPHPADAPDWLVALVTKEFDRTVEVSEHRTIEPTSPEGVRAIAWAREYLATRAEPAIEGQDGSGRLFHVACHLMYSALPRETLQEIVEEVYNPRCDPPWSQKEIEHKLHDADRDAEDPRGLASPDFWDRCAGRTKDTAAKVLNPAHEYTFEPGMRSAAPLNGASFGEVIADLVDHVDWAGVFKYDTFRDVIVAVNPPMKLDAETEGLSENDESLVRAWFEYHGKKIVPQDVRAAIGTVARRRAFDPRQDYLTKEITWDGEPRLDRVLPDYFNTADGPYELGIGPRWFISLVARAMRPGCQSDCTLILEGPQGIGKTSAFRALMPREEWYANTTAGVEEKDFKQNLLGIWLMGFDELDSLTKASLTKVKTELTNTRDHYRKSYGRNPKGFPRTVGFCGSTNTEVYFNDPTGARRYLPTKVLRKIIVANIVEDRDQIWAEAYFRWKAGEAWHIDTPELLALCEEEQEERLELDAWEEPIKNWLSSDKISFKPIPKHEDSNKDATKDPFAHLRAAGVYDASKGVTTGDVLRIVIERPKERQTGGDVQRVAKILKRLGMERTRRRTGDELDSKGKHTQEWRFSFPKL